VAEPDADRARILAQAQNAARAFAAGNDGTGLAPAEIQADVTVWRERLQHNGQSLDHERWLIGLLTLSCLARRRVVSQAVEAEK
jgi:hypothetical protein